MNCPACGNPTGEKQAGDIKVDVCESCGGIWFDNYELRKVDEPHEAEGEALLEVRAGASVAVDRETARDCPRCDDAGLRRHFFSVKREVEVDECPRCGGFWLDVGELASIRDQYDSEEARKAAAAAYFDEVFGDHLQAARAETDEDTARARRIANMFRFLCPSYYIPGDQEWGAF